MYDFRLTATHALYIRPFESAIKVELNATLHLMLCQGWRATSPRNVV